MSTRPDDPRDADARVLEREQQRKYRFYCGARGLDYTRFGPRHYFAKLAAARLALVREVYTGGRVLDLCCGAGDYLVPLGRFVDEAVGIDFSPELAATAHARVREAGQRHVRVVVANARALPLAAESVVLVVAFSSLYYIPRVQDAIDECARVLRPGGCALLEFGLLHSLNTLVCRAYPDLAAPCHVTFAELRRIVAAAGLVLERDRAFQLLPLWGDRPAWLRPLLHPAWKRALAVDVGDRMLDERLSSLPLVRRLAFRHLVVCRKPAARAA